MTFMKTKHGENEDLNKKFVDVASANQNCCGDNFNCYNNISCHHNNQRFRRNKLTCHNNSCLLTLTKVLLRQLSHLLREGVWNTRYEPFLFVMLNNMHTNN